MADVLNQDLLLLFKSTDYCFFSTLDPTAKSSSRVTAVDLKQSLVTGGVNSPPDTISAFNDQGFKLPEEQSCQQSKKKAGSQSTVQLWCHSFLVCITICTFPLPTSVPQQEGQAARLQSIVAHAAHWNCWSERNSASYVSRKRA